MKIISVVGNRPQYIKAAALCVKLREGHDEILVNTGQHYDREMAGVFFECLEIPEPDHQLGVGSGSHAQQTAAIIERLEPVLEEAKPGLVLVYGDTNSTIAAALTAVKLGFTVAHVEAGMRSFDRTMPEETNRVLTDHCSTLLFCPSQTAVDNLANEGITDGVHLVGDVMLDLALRLEPQARGNSILEQLGLQRGDYILLTSHRPANVDSVESLVKLLELIEALPYKTVFPIHPRTKASLERHGLDQRLSGLANLEVIEPVGYMEMLSLLLGSETLLTDSGGMQKEAYLFGVRCITLRENTEWVETVELGWNTLVGLDREAALQALGADLPQLRPELYGAGLAVDSLVAVIGDWAEKN